MILHQYRRSNLLAPSGVLRRFNGWGRADDYTATAKWLSVSDLDLQRGSTADGSNTNAPTFSTDRFDLVTDDYFEGASTGALGALLNLQTGLGFTAVLVFQVASLTTTVQRLIGKQNSLSAANNGWSMGLTTTSGQVGARIADGTTLHEVLNSGNLVAAAPNVVALRWDPATAKLDCSVNGEVTMSAALTMVANGPNNARPFRIGATSAASPANFLNASVFAWGVAHHYLSDADLDLAVTELGF